MSDEQTSFACVCNSAIDATTTTTTIVIPEDTDAKVIIKCGDESIGIAWRDLFQMLSSAVSTWRVRGL